MSSTRGTIYIGMTNDLARRIYEHKNELVAGFTKKYKCKMLVYWELSPDVGSVIEREKQLKRWSRAKKIELIKKFNPSWQDLSTDFIESR